MNTRTRAITSVLLLSPVLVSALPCGQRAFRDHLRAAKPQAETPERQDPPFVFERNDFGDEADWTIEYLGRVHAELVAMMDNPEVDPPSGVRVILERIPDSPALGGYATPDAIGFQASSWPRERFRLWILAHELTNLFANHYAGSGGFPSDWWSDGRSPFPIYTSALICEKLGEQETAEWLRTVDAELGDQKLYWALHEKFGFDVFATFFKLVRQDGIDLGVVGLEDWPSADECRSAYTIAYLSLAAGENLAPLFRRHGIGDEPEDWGQRHPDRPFVPYSVSDKEVRDLMTRRTELLETRDKASAEYERRMEDFREGTGWSPGD